jgi:hypothetical protein
MAVLSPRVGVSLLSLSILPSVPSTTEGEAIAAVVAPVLQTMPELQRAPLCLFRWSICRWFRRQPCALLSDPMWFPHLFHQR